MVHHTHCIIIHYFPYDSSRAMSAAKLEANLRANMKHKKRRQLYVRQVDDIHTCFPKQDYKNVDSNSDFYKRGQMPNTNFIVAVEGHQRTFHGYGTTIVDEDIDMDVLAAANKYMGFNEFNYMVYAQIISN